MAAIISFTECLPHAQVAWHLPSVQPSSLREAGYIQSTAEDTGAREGNYGARVSEPSCGGAAVGAPSVGLCHPPGAPQAPGPSAPLLSIFPTCTPSSIKGHMAPAPRPRGSQPEATEPPKAQPVMSGDILAVRLGGEGAPTGSSVGQGSAQRQGRGAACPWCGSGRLTLLGASCQVHVPVPSVLARCGHQHIADVEGSLQTGT